MKYPQLFHKFWFRFPSKNSLNSVSTRVTNFNFILNIQVYIKISKVGTMSDFRGNKEVARQLILDLKCSVCKDVPGFIGVRKRRYVCSKGKVSLLGVESLWGDCTFIPADWGS